MKMQLVFDTTDAASISASDSVGAFLRASDGTLLTHTDVGGKKALDVRLAEGVDVEVDLSHLDDSVRLGDGTSFFTSTSENSDIALDVHISNTSIEVTATQLDIDDLNATDDAVASWLHDGTGTAITSTGGAIDVNIASGTLNVNDAALADTAIATAAETLDVANTAQDIIVSPLVNRKYLYVLNKDNKEMEIGATGFSLGDGFPVSPGSYIMARAGASIDIEYNSTKVNHEIRTMELS